MNEHSWYRRIISGQAGAAAGPLRGALSGLAYLYRFGVELRNARYDRRGAEYVPPVPVVSVGNITVGGTGKTPVVIDLVQRLEAMGRNPVVVARGYKAGADAQNEEQRLIRRHCPAVAYVADPDRAAAARKAYEHFGADIIVLDDGFQHRRLGRSLDIVLIDATCPFGYGYLLPRGLLREPVESLGRADLVVLTRCNQVAIQSLAKTVTELKELAPQAVQLKCNHRIAAIEPLDGSAPLAHDGVNGRRVVLFAAVGNPGAFALTAGSLDVEIVGERWWPDHHFYRRRDIGELLAPGRFPPHDLLLTTEKDAVKLDGLGAFERGRIGVVKVAIEWIDDSAVTLQQILERNAQRPRSSV